MGRLCSVCHHEKRAEIELALLEGGSTSDTAVRYVVSLAALKRHRSKHMNAEARQALSETGQGTLDIEDPVSPGKALRLNQHRSAKDQLLNLMEKAEVIFDTATGKDAYRTKLAAVGEMHSISMDLAKLALIALELEGGADARNQGPPWPRIKAALVEVCRAHPEAREWILEAVQRIEHGEGPG